MTNTFLFKNLATTTLASPITNTATSLTVAAGTGSLFPSPTAGQQFALDLNDAATGQIHEIVYVTAVSGDTFTVVRGQEGTSALSWLAGDYAVNKVTAGTLASFAQTASVPGTLLGVITYAAAGTYSGASAPSTAFPAGTNTVYVQFGGGGGQGGGAAATTAGQGSTGSGGGAGAECFVVMTATAASGLALTVGAGGSGAAAGANGTAGSPTTFGTVVSCPGGLGGYAGGAVVGPAVTGESGITAAPTVSSPATLVWGRDGASSRLGVVMSPANISSGTGGEALRGPGAGSVTLGAGGNAPNNSGGGSGAGNLASKSAAAGGNGAPGYAAFYCYA